MEPIEKPQSGQPPADQPAPAGSTPESRPAAAPPVPPTGGPPRPSAYPQWPPAAAGWKRPFWLVLVAVIVFLGLGCGGIFLLMALFAGASGSLAGESRVQEKFFSHEPLAKDKVAIISVEGMILDGRGFVKREIDQVLKDDNVKAVVLRVDSPGGTVSGSDYIYHHLNEMARKREIPIVVSMGGLAASGGYYVSMSVGSTPDSIFAEPTTWTGSIGVIIPHYDASGLLNEKLGITQDSVVSGPYKGIGSYTKKMSPQERAILQALVDDSFAQFKKVIQHGRTKFEKDPEALNRLATGQVYSAEQALKLGLVDRIGYIEDAVDRAIELAGLDPDKVRVIEYKKEFSFSDLVLDSQSRSRGFDPAALADLTVPRAYYLWTWLPPALGSRGVQTPGF